MPLALVLAVTVLTHLAFAGARVAVALLALHLGASAAVVGVLAALFPALPMFFSVAAGRAIDRIGVVKPMLVGALAVAGGSLAAFAWPTLEALYAVSVVIGSGAMLSHIASNNAVGAIGKPPDRPRNFTLISLAFSTATFVGPVLAGLSIDGLGHARAFLVVGAFAVASAATIVLGRARFPRPTRAGARVERRMADLLAIRALRHVLAVGAVIAMTWEIFAFAVPIYGTGLGLSASTIGTILGAFALATFVARVVLPTLARRLREWTLIGAALAIAVAVFAVFPLVEQVPLLMALAFTLGLGLGMTQPLFLSLLYAATPEGRSGEAVGIRTGILSVCQTAMPLLFGAIGAVAGMTPVFWSMALVLAGGVAFTRSRR
ncbi:MAG: MFS transporter [Burkholderiales bacterium]